jgi:hypothetical protein
MAARAVPVRMLGALGRLVVIGPRRDQRVTQVAGHGLAGAVVAALLDPFPQRRQARLARIEGHRGRLRDRIRLHPGDARAVRQHALDDALLARVMQAADVQDRGLQARRAGPGCHD